MRNSKVILTEEERKFHDSLMNGEYGDCGILIVVDENKTFTGKYCFRRLDERGEVTFSILENDFKSLRDHLEQNRAQKKAKI
jgi:ribosomal protein S15P/S13E